MSNTENVDVNNITFNLDVYSFHSGDHDILEVPVKAFYEQYIKSGQHGQAIAYDDDPFGDGEKAKQKKESVIERINNGGKLDPVVVGLDKNGEEEIVRGREVLAALYALNAETVLVETPKGDTSYFESNLGAEKVHPATYNIK